jgi:hypothetical protein
MIRPGRARWHREALRISSALTLHFRRKYQPEAIMVTPETVIEILLRAKVRFMLMGTYGIEGYRSQPRATQDVDVLVRKADHRKAVQAIVKHYPGLVVQDFVVVTRFTDPATKQVVLDLMKPEQPVFKMAFKHTVTVAEGYLIPNLEMALTSKFAAMTSPSRDQAKKLIDGGDFVDMARKNLKQIHRAKLRRLADKIYPDGGREIIEMLEDIEAGRRIRF